VKREKGEIQSFDGSREKGRVQREKLRLPNRGGECDPALSRRGRKEHKKMANPELRRVPAKANPLTIKTRLLGGHRRRVIGRVLLPGERCTGKVERQC